MKLEIIFEDNDIIVCRKPAGVPTQTKRVGEADMVSLLKNHIYKQQNVKKEPYLAVIHRLDQPVEGLLVFAKTPFAAKELNKQLQNTGFGKHYLALLNGKLETPSGTLEQYLVKDGRTNTSRICEKNEKDARFARLSYEMVSYNEEKDQTLVRVLLDTGRHHQIRVQMAGMGHPIVGDKKYNTTETKHARTLALCAYRLEFRHPKTKKQQTFELETLPF